ncbi:hypothetical protein IJ707_04385, partial [bacterium]|nr:hypothetical protein [bacterium]
NNNNIIAKSIKETANKTNNVLNDTNNSSIVAKNIYEAVNGIGTNEKQLSNAVNQINQVNVTSIFDAWNSAGYNKAFGNDLIGAIQEDTSGSYQKSIETKIASALYERAQKFGMKEEATALKAIIEGEHKKLGFSSEEKIRNAINDIQKKISEVETRFELKGKTVPTLIEGNESIFSK